MNSCGQPGQLWRVAHPAHRHYYYDDEIGYHSVVKVQGGRFFNVKVGGFSKLIHSSTSRGLFIYQIQAPVIRQAGFAMCLLHVDLRYPGRVTHHDQAAMTQYRI